MRDSDASLEILISVNKHWASQVAKRFPEESEGSNRGWDPVRWGVGEVWAAGVILGLNVQMEQGFGSGD